MLITTVTQKGQVTIPLYFREMFGIKSGGKILFEEKDGVLELRPAPDFFSFRGALVSSKKYDKEVVKKTVGKYLAEKNLVTKNGKSN